MIYAAKTIAGIRPQNQDAVFIPEDGLLAIAAVADGMGGHNAGDVASALAIKTLVGYMRQSTPESVREKLINAVNMANSAVYAMSLTDDAYMGMGTTLVAAVLDKDRFIAVNVGDSRLYHFNGTELKQITEDHSYVAQLAALGYITKEEAARHPQRNIITRAVGTRPVERVDIFECAWKRGDKLLICTDGLYGGTIVDATIIHAPSSTKNKKGTRDKEMHQVKKGNQWYFGMKVHAGVDAGSGFVHTITGTAANVHDSQQASELIRNDDEVVYGDSGYLGIPKQESIKAKENFLQMKFRINKRPSSLKIKDTYKGENWDKKIERRKSSVRSKVEHPFLIVKRYFGYCKVAYKGIKKNMNRINMLFASANLLMCIRAERSLAPIVG